MLPENFLFSQTSLQDFVDCRRRFYLRYIQKIQWPAVQSEPFLENEKYIIEGSLLHEAIHQFLIGIPGENIGRIKHSQRFEKWWSNFWAYFQSQSAFTDQRVILYPEFTLIGTLAGHRLVAKFDLLVLFPDGNIIIFDWKTGQKHAMTSWLLKRMQSLVYPSLLISSGQHLIDREITPEKVSMIYWFSDQPDQPEIIKYNENMYRQNSKTLEGMIQLVASTVNAGNAESIPMTEERHRCTYCSYRSLCDTGIRAGTTESIDEDLFEEYIFEFEQISEVPF